MDIRAYIFDLDGTLLDTLPDMLNTTNRVMVEFGLEPLDSEKLLSFVVGGPRMFLKMIAKDRLGDEEFERFQEVWTRENLIHNADLTCPFPGIPEMLGRMKAAGCKLAVLSNKPDKPAQAVIGHFFPDTFDAVHGTGPDFPRKPDPTGLLTTIAELGLEPGECAYVGDSLADIECAKAAGALAIAVSWGYKPVDELKAAQPDIFAESALDICG